MNHTRNFVVAALSAATVLTAVGCEPYPQGPAGQVVSRDQRHDPATKASRFELTVRTDSGKRRTFRVRVDDYNACRPRRAYPNCTQD